VAEPSPKRMELDGRGDGIILEQIPQGIGELRKAMTCYGMLSSFVSGLSMIKALFFGPSNIIHLAHLFVLTHSYSELAFLYFY